MSIGDALSKKWTYALIEDQGRKRTGMEKAYQKLSASLALDVITAKIQKIAKRLNGASDPWFTTTNATLTISGSANPYTVDLSGVNPAIDKLVRVTHVTTALVRTPVDMISPEEAEVKLKLANSYETSVFGVHEGDSIRLYALGGFTMTIATDTIELKYSRQPKIGTVSSTSLVYDAAFTIAADGVTVSAFTGILAAHLGGVLVGTDSAAAKFAKPITSIAADLSTLTLGSAVAVGAATLGYIIPPNSYAYTVTRGTYVDLPDSYVPLLMDEVTAEFTRYKNDGIGDSNLEAKNDKAINDIYTVVAMEQAQAKAEK